MSPESRKGRPDSGPTTSHIPAADDTRPGYPTQPLGDQIDWWTSPALAYWQGLQDGIELARRQDEEDHRAAVKRIEEYIEIADYRRRVAS